jgi:hypothetical protein
MVGVILQNLQIKVIMWFNKDFNTLKKGFLIWSNEDIKIKATFVQIKDFKGIGFEQHLGGGEKPTFKN